MTTKEKVKEAERNTNKDPTEGQKTAGNYKKGKVTIIGFKISIENPIGSIRSGVDKNSNSWSNVTKNTYGYFNSTIGKDGDPIDVYLGTYIENDFDIYIIDQVEEDTRAFDEHKVMFGFRTEESAKKAYLNAFDRDWKGFDKITKISIEKFRLWINNKDAIKYPASKLSMKDKVDFKNKDPNDRVREIELYGEVIEGFTLEDLQRQAGDINNFDSLIVKIASPGGSVSEGLSIMVWFDLLSRSGIEVITIVTANAYSIASLIMLSADYRIISTSGKVMVHNPMVPELEYVNADTLEKYASELRNLESIMYELYQIFTGLKKEQIKSLMDNETYLTPQEAVDNGFADVILDIKPKSYEMAVNKNKEINMFKTFNALNRVISMINKAEFVNQLYYTSDGSEVQIFQKDPSAYAVGDRTSMKTGTVKISDGAKLSIVDFKIESIDKSVDVKDSSEGPAPKEILTKTDTKAVVVEDVVEGSTEKNTQDKNTGGIEAVVTEIAAEAIDKVVVAKVEGAEDPVEQPPTEDPAEQTPVEDPEVEDPEVEQVSVEGTNVSMVKDLEAKIESLKSQIEALTKRQSEMSKFEEVATQAIEALSKNTVSNFKPDSRQEVSNNTKGSIFQRMKQKRGLK